MDHPPPPGKTRSTGTQPFDLHASPRHRPELPAYVNVKRACVLHATPFAEDFGGDPRPRAPTDRRP